MGSGKVVAVPMPSAAFTRVDRYVREQLWRMLRRRHQNRSKKWLTKKYWFYDGQRLILQYVAKTRKGLKRYQVTRLGSIGIRRHRKIKAKANPYTQAYARYFLGASP